VATKRKTYSIKAGDIISLQQTQQQRQQRKMKIVGGRKAYLLFGPLASKGICCPEGLTLRLRSLPLKKLVPSGSRCLSCSVVKECTTVGSLALGGQVTTNSSVSSLASSGVARFILLQHGAARVRGQQMSRARASTPRRSSKVSTSPVSTANRAAPAVSTALPASGLQNLAHRPQSGKSAGALRQRTAV
jgi:hypothetical protein